MGHEIHKHGTKVARFETNVTMLKSNKTIDLFEIISKDCMGIHTVDRLVFELNYTSYSTKLISCYEK